MHVILHPGCSEPYDGEEYCPHCDTYIPYRIDSDCYQYEAICPVCGEILMLCTLCHDDYGDVCDYDDYFNDCRFRGVIQRRKRGK